MNRFNVVTNPVHAGLVALANLLCGCSHARTTFPITLQSGTYIACLRCGRHLPYDWTRMRITRRPPVVPAPSVLQAMSETGARSR